MRTRRRLSIASFLSIGMALMMAIAVGSVLAIGIIFGGRNLGMQLRDRTDTRVGAVNERLDRHLGPVEAQAAFLADWAAHHPEVLENPTRLAEAMRMSLAALPQVAAMAYVAPDYKVIRVLRNSGEVFVEDWANRPEIAAAMDAMGGGADAQWSPPFFSIAIHETIISYRQPIRVDGRFLGGFIPALTVNEMSSYLARLSEDLGIDAFILYGRDHVLAEPTMSTGKFAYSAAHPLPTLAEAGNPILARIWDEDRRSRLSARLKNAEAHYVVVDDVPIILGGDYYVYAYRRVTRFGEPAWIVGNYSPGRAVGNEVQRYWYMAGIGLGVLVVSIIVTVMLGRRLARPIREISNYAARIRDLKLDDMPPLPRNRVQELDEAAGAFNAMIGALRWFQTYIPRALVDRLLKMQGGQEAGTDERLLTVMFTDIVGFSTQAEHMSAQDVAVLLNEHFALVGGCIERHEGTIDKYIGDCVMAFWSAPIEQPDHARRAYLAAKEIEVRMRDYNEQRVSCGLLPIRMRIGIHTGKVVVGNIGFEGRINYTAVGDAVNVAQRIEQAGKEVAGEPDTVILVSGDTLAGIGEEVTAVGLGRIQLRGREEPIAVHRLM
ncbi:MAG: adenylate/guanylate cyclase domain-containing protein [Alphaproteobacteria bacterium]